MRKKKKKYWDEYGITICYDLSSVRYTRNGQRDYRYIRYKIEFPYLGKDGISFTDPSSEQIGDVKGSFIDYYIEKFFKKNPELKEAFKNEMLRIKSFRGE